MAHLSPRTKFQVHQIRVFKKATGRSRKMVTAELLKKAEPPPPVKRKTPIKGSGATVKTNVCPPAAPRPIKRTRAEDHVYDSSCAPEARRSVGHRKGVVPAIASVVDDVEPNIPAQSSGGVPDGARELHQGTSPVKCYVPRPSRVQLVNVQERPTAAPAIAPVVDDVEPNRPAHSSGGVADGARELHQGTSPVKCYVPRPSRVQLVNVQERPTAANDEESQLPVSVVTNGCHDQQAVEMDVETEQCSDYSPVVDTSRLVDNSVACAAVHPSPPAAQMQECLTASPQFENLLKRVGSPVLVCPTAECCSSVSLVTEVNGDTDAVNLRPAVQDLLRRSTSPEYILAPSHFHGLWNLGNTCYMNTVIQLLYNLECFAADLKLPAKLPLRRDGIFLGLRQVFQILLNSPANAVVNPTCLQHACEKYMTDFEGSIQQDAQEYLLNVLDQIEEEIALSQGQLWEESQIVPVKRESICPTTRNFSCQVRNVLSCEGCDNIVNVEQSSRHFSLPLPEDRRDPEAEIPDIEALMNIYFQVEALSRKCEKCGAETMKSETKIVQLPRVLILHINRFEIDRHMLCSKVSVPVQFSESLDLGKWCLDEVRGPCNTEEVVGNGREYVNGDLPALEDCHENCQSNGFHSNGDRPAVPQEVMGGKVHDSKENGFGAALSTSYSLHGVVSHVGKLASCGHYTVDIFDVDSSNYVRCDDSAVRYVSNDDVFCDEKFSEAYVLLYVLEENGSQHRR